MTSTQMEQLRLIRMENEQRRLREQHHEKHYQPYRNLDGQGQSVKHLKPLKKNIFFPNASHVHIHRGAEQRQNMSQEPPRATHGESRGLHERELYSKHNNQFPETSVHPRQNTERRPYTNLENQLAKEKSLTRTMQQKKVKKELLFLGGHGNQGASQNLPEIGTLQSRTNAGQSNDSRKLKGRAVGVEHLKAMNRIYAEKLKDAEQFRNAQADLKAVAQHGQPKGTKKAGRWKQKVSPQHQQLIARRPVGLYATSPRGGKTFDSLPAVGKQARDRDQELAEWAHGQGQQAATVGSWNADGEPHQPHGAHRIPMRGRRDDPERQPPRDEAWKEKDPGGRGTPGNSEPYMDRAGDFGGDAADLRAFQQESDRHSAQEGQRAGKQRGSRNRLDMLHEDSMPDFLSDDYTGADELHDLALNWPGPVNRDSADDERYKLDAPQLQVITDPPAVQAASQEGTPPPSSIPPRMETVTNQEASRAAKGIDFALADAAEERRAQLNKKARQAFLPEVRERSQQHLKLKKYLTGDSVAQGENYHTTNQYQVREEPAPNQFKRKRNLKSVLPAIRSSRNQTAGKAADRDANFKVADHQANRKKPNHTTSKKYSNPDDFHKNSLHTNARQLQPDRLPNVSSNRQSSKLLEASDSRQQLSSGRRDDGGLRSGLAAHHPRPLEHTRHHGPLQALGVKKPSGYSLKVTEFNPPHLHTQDRFEAHNRETCEGCQLAERRRREDDARQKSLEKKRNSSSPKKARLALDSAHRSPQRVQNFSGLSPARKLLRSHQSGSGSPEGSRHLRGDGEAGAARRAGRRRSASHAHPSHSPQGRPNLHLNNHHLNNHTQHSPEERPRIIGGGGRLSPSRYQLNQRLRVKEREELRHQTLSPKGRNAGLQLPSAGVRRPAKRINNFTPRHGEYNSPESAGRVGIEGRGKSGSPAARLSGQDGNRDGADQLRNRDQAGAPQHSRSPPRAGPPRVAEKYESAIGREKIWREAPPEHRRALSKDRFGRLAHDNKEVAGSPDSGRLRQPSGKRTKNAAPKQQQKKPAGAQPKGRARLPQAIDHNTASLRKLKPESSTRQRESTMPGAPDAASPHQLQLDKNIYDIQLPAVQRFGEDGAGSIRLQTSNLRQGRNLFENSNHHSRIQEGMDDEAKGSADVEENQEIEEDATGANRTTSSRAADRAEANRDVVEELPSEIVDLDLADQIDKAQAKRRNDASPFSQPPEYTAPLERSAANSNSQKPAAAEAAPGQTTPEGQASRAGSVERDSAPSQLNRVRFKDEVEDEAPPDVEGQSQNESNGDREQSSLGADVQGDVAILDKPLQETMSSKASGSRGPAGATEPAPQQRAVAQQQMSHHKASKTASSNIIGSKQSEAHKTLEKQSSRTSDVMSQLKRANSIRAPISSKQRSSRTPAQISSKSRDRSGSATSPPKLMETLGQGSTTEAEVSIISEQSTAKELAVNSHQRSGQSAGNDPSEEQKKSQSPSQSKENDEGPASIYESDKKQESQKGEQKEDLIHIQNQSAAQPDQQPPATDKSERMAKELPKEPSKTITSEAHEGEESGMVDEVKRSQSTSLKKRTGQDEQGLEELKLTASVQESSLPDDVESGQQRSRNDSLPQLAKSKHSLASVNEQLHRAGADSQFGMDEVRESRNHQLAQTQSLSRSPQKIEHGPADQAAATSGSRRQETEKVEKGILRNKDEQTPSSKTGNRRQDGMIRFLLFFQRGRTRSTKPIGQAGVPDKDALERRRQRQEAHRKKQSEKSQKDEQIGPNDWDYASAFKKVDSRTSAMQKTQDSASKEKMVKQPSQSTSQHRTIQRGTQTENDTNEKSKYAKSIGQHSEAKSKSQKSRKSTREGKQSSPRASAIDERSPRRSSKGRQSVQEKRSLSRKSGADDANARSLSGKRSSASAYPKWVDGKNHKSGVRAVESEVSHRHSKIDRYTQTQQDQAEPSPPRRQQTPTERPHVEKPQKRDDRHQSQSEERRKQQAQRGIQTSSQSKRSRNPPPQAEARPAVHQATSTGGQKADEQEPELCSSHQYSMSAMAMEASEAGEARPHALRTPPSNRDRERKIKKQKQQEQQMQKLKQQKVLVDTAQSPGALQESESSIESVDLRQVQRDVKEAATGPDPAFQVRYVEAQTMTSLNKHQDQQRGREIQTQTEPLSAYAKKRTQKNKTPPQETEEEPAASTPQSSEKHQTERASTVQDTQQEEGEYEEEAEESPDDEAEERLRSTRSSPAEQRPEQPETSEGPVDPLDATTAAPARDWYRSGIYDLALEVVRLPAGDQLAAARALEERFCNPKGLDIFTEAEAGYNASLLRQKGAAGGADLRAATDAAHDLELLQALYRKATRTVELLSEHVLLTKACGCAVDGQEHHDADHEEEKGQEPGIHHSSDSKPGGGALAAAQRGSAPEALMKVADQQQEPGNQEPASMALRHEDYREHNVGVETVIKLLLRCKKLYQAMAEVKKVLQLIIKQEELFDTESGQVYACLRKYRPAVSDPPLAQEDEAVLERGFRMLVQVSRRIAHFLDDHLIYKQFIYKGQEHRIALLKHAWKLHRFFKRKKGDDSHARLVDDIQKNLTASLEGLEDTSAQSSNAIAAEGGQEGSSRAASSLTAKRRDLAGSKRVQEDGVNRGPKGRATDGQRTLDKEHRQKTGEVLKPKGKVNSKTVGYNSRPTQQEVEVKEADPASRKRPTAQNQKSKPTGASLAKPKAQPTPAAPAVRSMPMATEAAPSGQSQNHERGGTKGQAASNTGTKQASKQSAADGKSKGKDQSSGKDDNRRAQTKQPSDIKKKIERKKQKEQNDSEQLDDPRRSQAKKLSAAVSQSQQSLAKSSKPSEKSRNARHGMQRGKRDEDQSMKSVSGSVQSKPGRAVTAGIGGATEEKQRQSKLLEGDEIKTREQRKTPNKEKRRPKQMASQGVQTSPAAMREQAAQATAPDGPKRRTERETQHQEQEAASKVMKETKDAGMNTFEPDLQIERPAFDAAAKSLDPAQEYLAGEHPGKPVEEIMSGAVAQQEEAKEGVIEREDDRVENATPSVGDAIQPPGSPTIACTPPLGAGRQHKPAKEISQQPRAAATETSLEIAKLTRSNELLASRVSQLASQLESSVDLDAMIKENYHLLRQGARTDGRPRRDGDDDEPANGRPQKSGARALDEEPSKVEKAPMVERSKSPLSNLTGLESKTEQRNSGEAKARGTPAGLAPRAEQHILLEDLNKPRPKKATTNNAEERSRTPAIPQHIAYEGAGQDQQRWSQAGRPRNNHEPTHVRHVTDENYEDSLKSQTTVGAAAQPGIARAGSISSVTELASFGKVIEAGKRATHEPEYGQTHGPPKAAGRQGGSWALAPQNTSNKSLPSKHFPEDFFPAQPTAALQPPGMLPPGDVQTNGHFTFVNQRASSSNAQEPIPNKQEHQ